MLVVKDNIGQLRLAEVSDRLCKEEEELSAIFWWQKYRKVSTEILKCLLQGLKPWHVALLMEALPLLTLDWDIWSRWLYCWNLFDLVCDSLSLDQLSIAFFQGSRLGMNFSPAHFNENEIIVRKFLAKLNFSHSFVTLQQISNSIGRVGLFMNGENVVPIKIKQRTTFSKCWRKQVILYCSVIIDIVLPILADFMNRAWWLAFAERRSGCKPPKVVNNDGVSKGDLSLCGNVPQKPLLGSSNQILEGDEFSLLRKYESNEQFLVLEKFVQRLTSVICDRFCERQEMFSALLCYLSSWVSSEERHLLQAEISVSSCINNS